MRFILAIFAFVIATALIGIGIAERTVLLPPSSLSVQTTQSSPLPYLFIDSDVLQSHSGAQTISLSGSKTVFAAYGRTADVKAWLNGSAYDTVAVDSTTKSLSSSVVAAATTGAANVASGSANPAGSDLWLEEYTSDSSLNRTFSLPAGYSMIVADDGTAEAPSSIRISWPLDNSTPFAVPLLLAGAFFVLVGLVLLLLGLAHMKKSRGPRRKPPALPRGKRFSSSRHNAIESGVKRGRRSISRSIAIAVPTVLLGSLALAGCSIQSLPSAIADTATPTPGSTAAVSSTPAATATPTPTGTATITPTPVPTPDSGPPPAVSEEQLNTILTKISQTATASDAAADAGALAARFTGPALDLRTETYKIRATDASYPAPQAVPTGPSSVVLPQATDTWPRTVFTIVENKADTTVAPLSLMLIQETPRSAYKVYYAIALEPDTTLPPVAPASVGTSRLGTDSKLLSITPAQAASGYADLLAVGSASPTFAEFDATGDTLRTSVGVDYKNAKKAGLANTASIDFAKVAGLGQSIALATNQSGAIVALNIRESEVVKVVEAGATVTTQGAVTAASGVTSTTKGTEAIYDYQLLFYIPPSGDTSKVKLLGFAQGLLSAKELP
ncbi:MULTISPECIES: hypothetical protein [Subtercola]|uniref:Glycosyl transferase n=1 Tax=Subtercola vilae TaxID=2056433 RepID=A0A4V4RFL7_9MICO|nr:MULTISPECIES: hypothetical protein [Subtercola]MEA9986290.1 hypothetical protein [Subtercola sp. RTI3]TIH38274.1 hypothetical protein D4765_06720 [Subtercola vilae]